uniref:Pre-rRNA-processing protein Ipi1 N-terminal domain-containing protein n=1 Tax=Salix viminalis TaxID=40686 RepID=A0A6N2N696_SALVM
MKMAKSKGSSKKQQKRGIDFKKIKRKMGRKLPPPKNTTNTEIKSKAIVLPEQSVASEKAGLAVSKKGLTLKELLQHTSHHNAKVRKDALMGMKDLFLKYPEELKLHRYAVIEKLRERISDDDKTVRENLYQLLKSVIFPGCKEDNQGPVISLMMAYIFNAMTHLAIDVRLMAFKFFDLAVQYHPPSFFSYAEKILQNYEDILWKNQFYLEDKGKLKNALAGLVRCLVLLPSSKEVNLLEKNVHEQKILHAFEPDVPIVSAEYSVIIKKLKDIVPVLVNCFQDFLPIVHDSLDAQSFDCMLSILRSIDLAVSFFIHRILQGHPESQPLDQSFSSVLLKKLLSVFPLCPTHRLAGKDDDRYVILNIAITEIFMHLSEWICPPADLFEKFLAFVEYVLLEKSCSYVRSGKTVREKQISTLIPFIPKLVSRVLGNWKHRLLLAFTKTFQDCSPESSVKLACLAAIEEMIISRKDLLCTDVSDSELFDYQITWIRELPTLLVLLGNKHPSSSQVVLHLLLRLGQHSLLYDEMQCLLKEFYSTYQDEAHELDSFMLFRIIEVLHSAYKAGHIQISDHISFFITLVSRFKVFPENIFPATESNMKTSNRGTFKSLTNVVCSCLSQMGDNSIVFVILEKVILEQISLKPPLDNSCAMLRMLIALDTKPTRLSERSICSLSDVLSAYLIDVAHCVPEDGDEGTGSIHEQTRCYYLLPCFFLFDRSHKLLNLVLNVMGSSINGSSASLLSGYHIRYAKGNSSRINATVSVLLWMQRDAKVQQILYSFKEEIDHISRSICSLQSSEEINVPIEERHIIKHAIDRLRSLTSYSISQSINRGELERLHNKVADNCGIRTQERRTALMVNEELP